VAAPSSPPLSQSERDSQWPCPYPESDAWFHSEAGKSGTFEGKHGTVISYRGFGQPGAAAETADVVIVVTGFAESYCKYAEVLHTLFLQGLSVYTMDHRSQGMSGQVHPSNPQMVHVHEFDDYVQDLLTFRRKIVPPLLPLGQSFERAQCFVLAHSMGGLVAGLASLEAPALFSKLVLSSPMLLMQTGSVMPPHLVHAIAAAGCLLGKGLEYVPGQVRDSALHPFVAGPPPPIHRWLSSRPSLALHPPVAGPILQASLALA
jgi:lysophospholipase